MKTAMATIICNNASITGFRFSGKLVGFIIILCILLNCLNPKIFIDFRANDTVSQAVIVNRSALSKIFSLVSISLRITGILFKTTSAKQARSADNDESKKTNSSSDYSILHFEKRLNFMQVDCRKIVGQWRTIEEIAMSRILLAVPGSGMEGVCLYFLLLMFTSIISRSYLGGAYTVACANVNNKTQLKASWVLLFTVVSTRRKWEVLCLAVMPAMEQLNLYRGLML